MCSSDLAIYPEGTRTKDGSMTPWREGGLRAILAARPWTVYLLVNDGYWTAAKTKDFVNGVGHMHGRSTVLGPFEWTDPAADPTSFIGDLRARMSAALDQLRGGPPTKAPA